MNGQKLSYDGRGINGPDEYRTRIATFADAADRDKYGPLFASAPELLAALESLVDDIDNRAVRRYLSHPVVVAARAAIAKATNDRDQQFDNVD